MGEPRVKCACYMRSRRGAERPRNAEDAVSLRSAEAEPLRLPIVRPANDDELRLTQNSHQDFADNVSGAMYHYCWRDSEDIYNEELGNRNEK